MFGYVSLTLSAGASVMVCRGSREMAQVLGRFFCVGVGAGLGRGRTSKTKAQVSVCFQLELPRRAGLSHQTASR